ncbi:hypothetical protein [Mucilaginibacter paludis]|uniref:Lipoprotein n=1 Tax=Mucilaginibacter paludis DSM 18603 TaxID=714943 RepID=H1Y434_9SPHI|nr:hypothetical protein [Mucilaginibacter paludis]EHQ24770.1 hypothetical protein Mucpa_0578 [Mucilaginibacter paludis DSM 18603]
MKTIRNVKINIILTALTTVILSACSHSKEADIAGTYVATYRNEYTIGNDTLEIVPYHNQIYQVIRRTGYQKIRDGKILPKEFKQVKWTATYVQDKQVLQETEFGKQLYMKPGKSLLFGDDEYKRLK